MSRLRKALGLGVVVATVGIALRPTGVGMRLEEDVALPALFAIRGPVRAPQDVAVVSIDKTSSDQAGAPSSDWPPSRHVHASVVRGLTKRGASIIVMDVFFRVRRTPAEDDDLADAITRSGRVVLFESVNRLHYPGGDILEIRLPIGQFRDAALATAAFPLPEGPAVNFFWTFVEATAGQVPTLPAVALQMHAAPDLERFLGLLRGTGAARLEGLPDRIAGAAGTRQAMNTIRSALASRSDAAPRLLRKLAADDAGLPDGQRGRLAALVRMYSAGNPQYLNFYGPAGQIRTIPYHEVLADTAADRLDLKGAVVFVGEGSSGLLSSPDQRDTYRTVYTRDGVDLSGVEIAATAFANLMENRTLKRLPLPGDIGILVAIGLLSALLARALPGMQAVPAILALLLAHGAVAQYLFMTRALLVPLGVPLLVQAPVSLFLGVLLRYRDLRRQVPREAEPGKAPDLVEGVCLATDIENYAAASAGMTARDLALLMNEYYDTIATIVSGRRGLMMGRAGDSAMCVWEGARGARLEPDPAVSPTTRDHGPDPQARRSACLAALEISAALDRFNHRHATPLRTRLGLHVGEVAMGTVGGEYHVVGHVANTASRIENLNKQLGTTVLASDAVVLGLDGLFVRPLGRFILAGGPGELEVVELVGREESIDQPTRARCRRFADALATFHAGRIRDAGREFDAIAADHPSDGPTRYYQQVCAREAAGWEGRVPPALRMDKK